MQKEIERLAHDFYYGHQTKRTALKVANKVAATIAGAVAQGYGKDVFAVDWNSADRKQIEHLQQNVYQFSFAKTHEQLKATTQALHSDGKIVPFTEFREVAQRINNEYTNRYLPIEYNTAISSAQMGSRWIQYQEEKDDLPFLTYRTVGDGKVRSSHQLLDGVTRAIDDFIWDTIFAPNGWNCRCDIEQSVHEKVTPLKNIVVPTDIPPMFKTNLAKSGLIFPADHPYFDRLPEAVIKTADNNNPFLYEKTHAGKKGGYVYQNSLTPTGKDFKDMFSISKTLANSGDKVIMLPEINPNTEWKEALRNIVLPDGVKQGTNSDAIVNGNQVVQFKTSSSNTQASIKQLIKAGSKQSDVICVKLTEKVASTDVQRALKGQVMQSKSIREIWIIDVKDKITKYNRSEITGFFKKRKQK
ncbi:phage head morphogenesis protein [Pedobacter sp. NJ-S-72]